MKNKIKIYLFGDSICFGQLVGSHRTWATRLCETLESLNTSNQAFLVQNAGVNGNTTRQALERISYDVTSHAPNYIYLQFGMNDCNYWIDNNGLPRVSPRAFVANLVEIAEKCFAASSQRVFLATNHLSRKGMIGAENNISYDQSNENYNELIREAYHILVNKNLPASLLDHENDWKHQIAIKNDLSLEDLLLEDGIHLSSIGHELYSEYLQTTLIPHITG